MRLDLHCHSTCSDGSLDPEQLCARVAKLQLALFCLTDHDTMDGFEATRAGLPGVRVLRGLELSCKWERRNVHLLLYGIDAGDASAPLRTRLQARREERRDRVVRIAERLAALGHAVDLDAVLLATQGRTPGRPDVARALVAAGHCSSMREAFDRFLHDDGPADVAIDGLSVADGCELARRAGARISLAHPHTLRHPELVAELLRTHRDRGLDAIEAFYGAYGAPQRNAWCRLARELDLVVTAGSDFHGEAVPQVTSPGVELPAAHVERLLAWLPPAPEPSASTT